jgi:hypothetical protein
MAEINYAFIKDGEVVNVAVFEYPTDEQLLDYFKGEFSLDNIILATDKTAVGGTYDGTKFWLPKPYPSWVKGADDWEAPVAPPEFDEEDPKDYTWDEATVSWVEVTLPTE